MSHKVLLFSGILAAALAPIGAAAQSGKKGNAGADTPACGPLAFTDGEMVCSCEAGAFGGSVWGSGPYTGDSDICTAARHSGALPESGGIVRLTEAAGQASYTGTTANGVTTRDWGSYNQSFAVVGASVAAASSDLAVCSTIPANVDDHACFCPENARQGSVWGNGPYTADSDICTAALHSGYIEPEGGEVYVLRVMGLAGYIGGEGYGVTTSDWGSYDSSIIFDWNR